MDRKQLEGSILSEIGELYKGKNKEELVELFVSVMLVKTERNELAGVEERQYAAYLKLFDDETTIADIKVCLSDVMKVEPLLKKILLLVDENKYEDIQKRNGGLAEVVELLELNPKKKKLDTDPQKYIDEADYLYRIASAYNLRNAESHTYETWNRREIYENLASVIICCLCAIERNRGKIIGNIKNETIKNELYIDDYLNEIVTQFKTRMSRFVHIRGEENFAVLGSYVIESQDESSESKRRSGTVENLRDTNIPEKRMMIWGEAGTGKSTTLEYLAYVDAKRRLKNVNDKIPVLVLLGLLTSSDYTIRQFICDKLNVSSEVCEMLLKEGKINLFIDGLNEIPNDNGLLKTLRMREIKSFIQSYPNTFIIITNRPQDSRDFSQVPIFNLIKLSKSEIDDFIEKNVDEKEVKKILHDAIDENQRFIQIINTPLILSRLIEIVKYKGEVPQSEGEIISEFLSCLFTREKEEKQDARLDIKKMTYLLRMIAYESLEKKETNSGMKESEIITYCKKSMTEYKFEYDALYAIELATQLGILEMKERVYVFSHQAYQDHYHALEELAVLES